jgi:hypothetical protein
LKTPILKRRAIKATEKALGIDRLKGTGFSGCGKTLIEEQEVSGRDFRAFSEYM